MALALQSAISLPQECGFDIWGDSKGNCFVGFFFLHKSIFNVFFKISADQEIVTDLG